MNREFPFEEFEWKAMVTIMELSPRQAEVSQHLLCGMADKQIAKAIGIEVPTVRTHIARLFEKLDVRDRVELVLYFVRESKQIAGLAQKARQYDGQTDTVS